MSEHDQQLQLVREDHAQEVSHLQHLAAAAQRATDKRIKALKGEDQLRSCAPANSQCQCTFLCFVYTSSSISTGVFDTDSSSCVGCICTSDIHTHWHFLSVSLSLSLSPSLSLSLRRVSLSLRSIRRERCQGEARLPTELLVRSQRSARDSSTAILNSSSTPG